MIHDLAQVKMIFVMLFNFKLAAGFGFSEAEPIEDMTEE